MRQDAGYFEDKDPILVYIAKKLKDALRLEETLEAAGINYGVETDEYRGGVVFQSSRIGAFFYVERQGVEAAHDAMRRNGFKPAEDPEYKK